MLEEIPLVDVEPEPSLFTVGSENLSDPIIITNGDWKQQQPIMTRILEQGKNAFPHQPSYFKLVEDESESGDPVRQRISSDGSVLPCKKQHYRCLCYILLTILSIVLIFLSGFGFGQTFRRQSMIPSSIRSEYTSLWTNDSSMFGIVNTSISNYYYAAFEISVVVASNYSFSTESNINTYGYIYNNTFHPNNPSINLFTVDGNGGENGQFKLTVFLQPWTSYILVVKTFSHNATGRFLIIASGPATVALRHIPSLPMVQSRYNGRLNTNSTMYCRDGCDLFDYYYEAIVVSVDKVGSYNFRSQSDFDADGSIYANSFDSSYPSVNLLAHDDDGGEGEQFDFTVVLQSQSTYILVMTTYSSYVTGSFQIIASGPMPVSFIRASNPPTTLRTTGTTTKINTTPWSVQSTYSSAWTTESQSYCRTSCSISYYYYYEAIQVRVGSHGIFSLASKSNVDTYGYLYNSSFDPFSPSSNLLLQDDEDGNNGQFKLTFFLEPDFIYILVATTFDPNAVGSFSISASGPGSVFFSAYLITQTL